MNKLNQMLVLIFALFLASAAHAHHSFSATFAKDQKTTVQGVVTDFSFRNPHVLLYLDVANEDGTVTAWVSEGNSATLLRRNGWDRDTFKAGDIVRVGGDASNDDSPMTSIDYVEKLDENYVVVETLARDNRVDLYRPAERENVPLRLSDGRPNVGGIWAIQYRGVGPPPVPDLPLNDAGKALQSDLDLANDPQVFCDPPGLIRQAVTHHPLEFTLLEDRVILKYEEFAGYREIFFDDRAALGIKTHLGDSIARYEDDKLIIETTNLLGAWSTTKGHRHSDQATVVETYSRADAQASRLALALEIVMSDPVYLAEDLIVNKVLWDAGAEYVMLENDCKPPLRERQAADPAMNFFLTSVDGGDGANLGGLEGADAHCAALATNVGQGDKNWRAYLSTTGDEGVDARDRIGTGPWYNAEGVPIARDLADLHSDAEWLTKGTAVDERGRQFQATESTVQDDGINSKHDILTGSELDGTASTAEGDTTCANWTSNSAGSALIGHADRRGGGVNPGSWNYAHPTRGCSPEFLASSDGVGLFYCFAID